MPVGPPATGTATPACFTAGYAPRVIAAGQLCVRGPDRWLIDAQPHPNQALGNTGHRLIHVRGGSLRLRLEGQEELLCPPGTVLYLKPGVRGELALSRRRNLLGLLFIAGNRARRFADAGHPLAPLEQDTDPKQLWGQVPPLRLAGADARAAMALIQRIRALYWRSRLQLLRSDAWLGEFLSRFASIGRPPALLTTGLEADARSLFHSGVALRVADLAARAGCSERQLRRRQASARGERPGRILADLRLAEARRLLAGGAKVAAVASACGYLDAAAFARAFRRRHGASPSAWRGDTTETA